MSMNNERSKLSVGEFFSSSAKEFLKQYESDDAFEERTAVWQDVLQRYTRAGMRALDAGCGPGVFSFYLAARGLNVTGIDISTDMLQICEERRRSHPEWNLRFEAADIEEFLNSSQDVFHVITCSSVLEYVEDIGAVFEHFSARLGVDGVLLVSLPNADSLYRKLEPWLYKFLRRPEYYGYVKHLLSAEQLKGYGTHVRLNPIEVHYYAHSSIISAVGRGLGLSPSLTGDLVLGVFRKLSSC